MVLESPPTLPPNLKKTNQKGDQTTHENHYKRKKEHHHHVTTISRNRNLFTTIHVHHTGT